VSKRFEGQGVVVTGGAQGMGRAIAQAFAEEGAGVLIADLDIERAEATAAELDGGRVIAARCDVRDGASFQAAIDRAIAELGRVDVLANNAGAITMNKVVDLSDEEWDLNMDVNAKGVFNGTRAVLPHMLERGSGSIVNTSSEAGKMGMPLVAHYCAAKAAVIGFTRAVAREVAPHVRVNAICPGTVQTEMLDRLSEVESKLTGASRQEIDDFLLSEIPMGRFQKPSDIANVVLFLCSDAASEMTGQALNVTGGKVQS
jgi:NAD(P)-dependent dehydrogenase (short-subunit alcohol dehydrogenase family)